MAEPRETARLACVGDIMCGDSFYAIGHGVASSIDGAGAGFFPAETASYLTAHDVVLANIEAPLSDAGRRDWSLRSLHMRGRASTAELLRRWGVTVGTLANNHVLEHGLHAATDTARQLRAAGIEPLGAGRADRFDNTAVVSRLDVGSVPLSFIGACTLTERYAHQGYRSWADVVDLAHDESEAGRVVVVTLHWGQEFINRPGTDQIERARELADAGVALVAGHHPHVAQGVAQLGSTLVAFSLGNFVFNGFVSDTRWSYVLSVELDAGGVVGWSVDPVEAGPDHAPHVRPAGCAGGEEAERGRFLAAEIERRNQRAVQTLAGEDQDAYQAEVAALTGESRRLLRRELLARSRRYSPVMVPQLLARPLLRRAGRW